MRLKVVTTGLLVFGLATLLLGYPYVLSKKPPMDAPDRAKAEFALMLGVLAMVLLLVAVTLVILALALLRRTRMEAVDEARENMRQFVEGTLRDHTRTVESGSAEATMDQPAWEDDDEPAKPDPER